MRSFILVAVVLQLAAIITHSTGQYTFGDIIAFPRDCVGPQPGYIHFGVYVGPAGSGNPDVGQGDNDMFHFSGESGLDKPNADCVFGKLQEIRKDMKEILFNYLDGVDNFQTGTAEQMRDRINQKKGKCKPYDLVFNNCEHLVTLVRYDKPVCMQLGARCQCVAPQQFKLPAAVRQRLERVRCERVQL